MGGEPGVALAEHRESGALVSPAAGGEVPGTDLGERLRAQPGGNRTLVEDVAPDQHLGRLDTGGRGERWHDRVAVRHVHDHEREP
jgi:hypothetical protein